MQFKTRLILKESLLDQVRVTRLLGVLISDDLSWSENTKHLVKRANSRMIILRKLIEFDVEKRDLINIYVLFIRSVIEQSSVVWSSSLNTEEQLSLERTQKVALRIIYQSDYKTYDNALNMSKLPKISTRHHDLLLRFASKCVQNEKTQDIIPLSKHNRWSRHQEKYHVPLARKNRFYNSAVPTMARMLNQQHKHDN